MTRLSLAFVPLLLLLAGCGGPTSPPLFPLTGKITTADGKAVTAGGLIFVPESGSWGGRVVNASVNPDGSFDTTTSTTTGGKTELKAGVPAGRYKVVYHPPGDGQKLGLETELLELVTVEAGPNVIQLVLPVKQVEEKRDP